MTGSQHRLRGEPTTKLTIVPDRRCSVTILVYGKLGNSEMGFYNLGRGLRTKPNPRQHRLTSSLPAWKARDVALTR